MLRQDDTTTPVTETPHGSVGLLTLPPDHGLDVDEFDTLYQTFATLTGTYRTSVLPGEVYADQPELLGWVHRVRDAYLRGELTFDQRARMEALTHWTWLTGEPEWLRAYRDLELLLLGGHFDLSDDAVFDTTPALAWARHQQRDRDRLTGAQVGALEALPGWSWFTRGDLRAAGLRTTLRFQMLHKATPQLRHHLGRLLALPDADLCAAVDAGEVPADVLDLLADPAAVTEADTFEQVIAHLPASAPPVADAFVAGHLRDFVNGNLDVFGLTALSFPDISHVVDAYRSWHATHEGAATHTQHAARPEDRELSTLLDAGSADALRRAGIVWRGHLRQLTAEEVRAIVGDDALVSVLIRTDPARRAGGSGDAATPSVGTDGATVDVGLRGRHIAFLNLSVRSYNVLMREGLTRVGDVLAIEDAQELLRMRGFGETCLRDLRTQLAEHGATPLF